VGEGISTEVNVTILLDMYQSVLLLKCIKSNSFLVQLTILTLPYFVPVPSQHLNCRLASVICLLFYVLNLRLAIGVDCVIVVSGVVDHLSQHFCQSQYNLISQ
jgi:hypothetical protein